MATAQEALIALHNSYGFSDSALGEALGVSREHICRLRNGAKQASVKLEDLARTLYNAQFTGQQPARITSRRAPGSAHKAIPIAQPPVEEAFFLGFTKKQVIIAGVVITAAALIIFALWYRSHYTPRNESENTEI